MSYLSFYEMFTFSQFNSTILLSDEQNDYDLEPVSQSERQLRVSSNDYCHRYLGHCNTTTDIKEANFLGQDSQFIVAG